MPIGHFPELHFKYPYLLNTSCAASCETLHFSMVLAFQMAIGFSRVCKVTQSTFLNILNVHNPCIKSESGIQRGVTSA